MENGLTVNEGMMEDGYGHNAPDADLIVDKLVFLVNAKQDLRDLLDGVQRRIRSGIHSRLKDFDFQNAAQGMEDHLDDLLGLEWKRLVEELGSHDFPASIPSVASLRMRLRVPTNPQTHKDMGVPV